MVRENSPDDETRILPEQYWAADQVSLQGRQLAVRWYRWQLLLLVAAAVIGSVPWRGTPLLAAAAFLGAGWFWFRLRSANPQARWHEARAAAESFKTLAWKYAVRAHPFEGPADSAEAEERYLQHVAHIEHLLDQNPDTIPPGTQPGVSDGMRELRGAPLATRRARYLSARVDEQRVWYRARAEACESQSAYWSLVVGALTILGTAAAIADAATALPVPVFAAFAAAATAVIAWTQLQQLRPLATAYLLAASELLIISGRLSTLDLNSSDAEESWAKLSADAEESISREHTTWRARRAFVR
ncbi:DUF4231 domain-containing protein [Kitasatospora terrestris]|uniref:DUF4231 domain-containing protein n=1 Tax=Kitasatospora terrestris TaxID=258051 RepID=A0ABP9DJ13_9ACTN